MTVFYFRTISTTPIIQAAASLSFSLDLIPPRVRVGHTDPSLPHASVISIFFLQTERETSCLVVSLPLLLTPTAVSVDLCHHNFLSSIFHPLFSSHDRTISIWYLTFCQ